MQTIRRNVASGRQWESGVRNKVSVALMAFVMAALTISGVSPVSAATLEKIAETGKIRIGYLADARPFSFAVSGKPEGYAIALCENVVQAVKAELSLPAVQVSWTPVSLENRGALLQSGELDLLCTPMAETLQRRRDMAFSIPIFAGGVRAVMRTDAATALRDALAGVATDRPLWRGSPAAKLLNKKRFVVVKQSTSESWLEQNLSALQIDAEVKLVSDYRSGLDSVLNGQADVFFGERVVVLGTLNEKERAQVEISERLLTHEPMALGLARGDDDFRLVVDSALSQSYQSDQFPALFSKWFGSYSEQAKTFYMWNAIAP